MLSMKGLAKAATAAVLSAAMVISMASCSKNTGGTSSKTTKSATINMVDFSDQTKDLRNQCIQEFESKNPGVKINYTCLTQDQARNTILTAVSANNAPDMFPVPVGMYLATAVKQNWYTQLDKYLPKSFLSTFSDNTLNEGITSINKKLYVLPQDNAANAISIALYFYNKKILSENNIDPSKLTTWTSFENACKTITANGKGQYYGLIDGFTQASRLEMMVRNYAAVNGAKCNDYSTISFTDDGKSWYNTQAFMDAMGYLQKLGDDKVFDPDSASISATQARALFGQGKAAFIMQGAYCIQTWESTNKDLDFGVIPIPYPDSGKKGSMYESVIAGGVGISSQTKNADICAQFMQLWDSTAWQGKIVSLGGYLSNIKGVNDKYVTDTHMKEFMSVSSKNAKLCPNPIIGNPNCAYVYAEAKNISPSIGQIVQGVLTGGIKDYKSSLNKLADATSTEWKRAIDTVNSQGNKVSISDFEFPNWDTSKDYTTSDYANKAKSSSSK